MGNSIIDRAALVLTIYTMVMNLYELLVCEWNNTEETLMKMDVHLNELQCLVFIFILSPGTEELPTLLLAWARCSTVHSMGNA